jgi:DHA2 family multidrug resistance protein-like MFS transporter
MMSSASLPANRWIVLVAVMLAFLPVVLDMTILHVAVPTLTQSLNASGTEVLWIIDIYPLLMAGLLVPMGTLADRVGNRRMLLIGLVIFGVASAWAAFAQSAAMLIAARILLALGGSMIMPCVLGLIRKTFEDEGERAMALGLWGMVGAAGAAVGPLVGGALLEHFWWGSVFLINVPVMLVVAPACYFLLPRSSPPRPANGRSDRHCC